MEKVALITGVNGQDGSYLAELLLSKNYTVVGLIRRTVTDFKSKTQNLSEIINNDRLILEEGDVSDFSSITKLVLKYRPIEIYNLAAQSHVGTSFKTPFCIVL